MATIEYITKRIEGKEKEIQKLTKKIERINKAKETNWEVNPYYYDESDLKSATRDLEKAEDALRNLQNDLRVANEKAASRNVPAILEFLENWKKRVFKYHKDSVGPYTEALKDYYKADSEYVNWVNKYGWETRRTNPEEYKRRRKEINEVKQAFQSRWSFLLPYVEHHYDRVELNEAKLQKDLNDEADRKYDFIIERTNAIVGEITDASHLEVGYSGELNGFVFGTNGTAKVQTIGAGGYNIQCYHFRTLIHPVEIAKQAVEYVCNDGQIGLAIG